MNFYWQISELEHKISVQNELIIESNKQLSKLLAIQQLAPHLEKLLRILKSIDINDSILKDNNVKNSNKIAQLINGECSLKKTHSKGNDVKQSAKKSVKYKCNETEDSNQVTADIASVTSSSTSDHSQSPSAHSDSKVLTTNASVRTSFSKLNIARSFNITSNFSDDEESYQINDTSQARKKKWIQ